MPRMGWFFMTLFLSILERSWVGHFWDFFLKFPKNFTSTPCVNPIPPGGGVCLFDPLYHGSVCRIYRTRTRFTKIHDFVPFGICQDPVKPLLTFFSRKFEIFDVEIFWGSSSIRKIWKNLKKNFFWKKTQNFEILIVKWYHT